MKKNNYIMNRWMIVSVVFAAVSIIAGLLAVVSANQDLMLENKNLKLLNQQFEERIVQLHEIIKRDQLIVLLQDATGIPEWDVYATTNSLVYSAPNEEGKKMVTKELICNPFQFWILKLLIIGGVSASLEPGGCYDGPVYGAQLIIEVGAPEGPLQ